MSRHSGCVRGTQPCGSSPQGGGDEGAKGLEGKFARALAAVRRAGGAMGAAERATNAPGLAIEQVFALEEVYGGRLVEFNRALARLLAAPAPDLAALAAKIGFAADYEAVTLNGCEECLRALKADAVRLASKVLL